MKENSLTDTLSLVIAKESSKFLIKGNKLDNIITKFRNIGIDMTSSYSLPLKDTIGRSFNTKLDLNLKNNSNSIDIGNYD